jgi:hypothetical protein
MGRNINADWGIGMTPRNQITAKMLGEQNSSKGLLNSAIGLGESMYGNKLYKDQIKNIKGDWREQLAGAQPGNVIGGDVETYFDPETKTVKQKLSDRRQGMLTGLYGQTGGYANQLANLNPYQLADHMYSQNAEARNLAQDREKAQILEMMNARGIDTSTMGNNLFGSTVQSQNLANAQERSGYMTQAQDIANAIADRQNAAIGNIYGQDAINSQGIADAVSLGTDVAPPSTLGPAYQDQVDAKAKTGGGIADILGMVLPGGGLFSKLF